MTSSTTVRMPMQLRRRRPFAAATGVLATVAAAVVLAISVGTDQEITAPVQAPSPSAQQQSVKELSALSDAELAAAFGTEGTDSDALASEDKGYVKEISSMSREQQAAAFGTGR